MPDRPVLSISSGHLSRQLPLPVGRELLFGRPGPATPPKLQ
jgi:hypothetical protein